MSPSIWGLDGLLPPSGRDVRCSPPLLDLLLFSRLVLVGEGFTMGLVIDLERAGPNLSQASMEPGMVERDGILGKGAIDSVGGREAPETVLEW